MLNTVITKLRVLYAEEYPRPDYNEMLEKVYWLYRQVQPDKVCVDGSAADFVQSLKLKIGERGDYLKEKQEYKAQGLDWEKSTKVLPLYFGRQNKADANPYQDSDRQSTCSHPF